MMMKTQSILIIVIVFGFIRNTVAETTYLTVSHHIDTGLTNEDFDKAMADANEKLRMDNLVCGDVPCTARFQRSGNLTTFGTPGDGLDILDKEYEVDKVLDAPGKVKVVTDIQICNGYKSPSIVGCAGRGSFVVEATASGTTYLHEYGHLVGLAHRDDCPVAAIMGYEDGGVLNQTECNALGGRAYTKLSGVIYDGNGSPLTPSGGPYWITGNVLVPSAKVLTIQPGVEIQFKPDHKITVDGTLKADGGSKRILLYAYRRDAYNLWDVFSLKINHQLQFANGAQLYLHHDSHY